jgi:hypothetical protein
MADSPKRDPADPTVRAAIANEFGRALENLGAHPDLASKARDYDTEELLTVIRNLGGKPDILGIVGSYRDTHDDEDVLHALRVWNEAQEREKSATPG